MTHQPIGKKMIRGRRDTTIAAAEQKVFCRTHKIARRNNFVDRLRACSFRFSRVIEQQRDTAVAFEEREPLPFDNAKVARVAQVICMPVVAIKKQPVDIDGFHGAAQLFDARPICG
jgi:hypothetical protein